VCNRNLSPPICDGVGSGSDGGQPSDSVALGPWGAPTLVMTPAASEDDPTLTTDMLELLFNRDGTTIWRITRPTITAAWSAPALVAELSPPYTTPELTPDGLTLYIGSNRIPSLGSDDIFVATRADRSSPWSAGTHVPELSSPSTDGNAAAFESHHAVVISRRIAGGNVDILLARRATTTDPWGILAPLPINSSFLDGDAMLSADELSLYFYSNRPGGQGDADIWVATRPSPAYEFGTVTNLAEINTSAVDQDPWISPDQRTLIFASDRSGQMAIYQSTR
jgi:Tol biopolymer transport system component